MNSKNNKQPSLLRVRTGGLRLDAKLDGAATGDATPGSSGGGAGELSPLDDMVTPLVSPAATADGVFHIPGTGTPEPESPLLPSHEKQAEQAEDSKEKEKEKEKKRTSSSLARQRPRSSSPEDLLSVGHATAKANGHHSVGRPQPVDTADAENSLSSVPGTVSRPPSRPATPAARKGSADVAKPLLSPDKPSSSEQKVHMPTSSPSAMKPARISRQMTTPERPAARTMTMRVQPLPNQSPKAGMTIVSTTITRTHTVYQRQQTTNSNLNRTQTMNSRVGQQTQEPQQSSHEQRVKELKNAVRTLSFLSGCVFVLGALCIVVDLPDSLASLLGSYADDSLLYGPRRDEYSIMAKAFPIIQNINLAVVVWYTWTPWLF
jgi:hypothetical protein